MMVQMKIHDPDYFTLYHFRYVIFFISLFLFSVLFSYMSPPHLREFGDKRSPGEAISGYWYSQKSNACFDRELIFLFEKTDILVLRSENKFVAINNYKVNFSRGSAYIDGTANLPFDVSEKVPYKLAIEFKDLGNKLEAIRVIANGITYTPKRTKKFRNLSFTQCTTPSFLGRLQNIYKPYFSRVPDQ